MIHGIKFGIGFAIGFVAASFAMTWLGQLFALLGFSVH